MYNDNHDCPFEAYITNLGKYNEGQLVGEWVKFPTSYEEMQKVFERINIGKADEFGNVYEEWFITDYDCYVDGIHEVLGEYESLDELNYLANSIEAMDNSDFARFEVAIEVSDYARSIKDLINLTDNLDKYDFYPDIHNHDDLGRMYIEEYGAMEVPDHLKNYIDYEAYGRDIAMDEIGHFTNQGYVRDTGDSFTEHYDGSRDDIPDEYRVMSKPETAELSEDEKLDMTTDLAFDLDEFFRQKDPQYAAAHPDEHMGKELIADLLMEGKTAAIKDRLTEMAQMLEDELLSRIDTYEQDTGYEAYLDTDVPAIREKLEQAQEPIMPDDFLTGDKIEMPRGSFSLTAMSREQMESAGYGFHHNSEDGKYHIMGNGNRAFAIQNEEFRAHVEIPEFIESVQQPEVKLTFYVAECMEFTSMGEYHDNLTLLEAVKLYQAIPAERMNGIKGIGFSLEDNSIYSGMAFPLVQGNTIDTDALSNVSHYQENPLVQQAVRDLMQELPNAAVLDSQHNYLQNAEIDVEGNYNMIDGIINNSKKEVTPLGKEEKPSVRERLAEAKRECTEHKPHEVKKSEKKNPGHDL